MTDKYLEINRNSWNNRVSTHLSSDFYNVEAFMKGQSSLKEIELALLGNINGKSVLHLQCHFGQDTLSLARMGAEATGVDLSDKAISEALKLNETLGLNAKFICSDIYTLPHVLNEKFDVVFTSYGTIGWLPDLNKWAEVISHFLKPEGRFIFVEFHPVVWMFDDEFKFVKYSYHNSGAINESESGTYADRDAAITQDYVMWNHGLAEVFGSLLQSGMQLISFQEFNYSPYNCFSGTKEAEPGKFIIGHIGNKLPMVYSVEMKKTP